MRQPVLRKFRSKDVTGIEPGYGQEEFARRGEEIFARMIRNRASERRSSTDTNSISVS